MIDVRRAAESLSELSLLPYFPTDESARAALVGLMSSAASNNEQIEWTVAKCLAHWDKWEGPHELRALLCSKFRPADGVEVYSRLPQFADGIPSDDDDRNQTLIGGAGEVKRLPPGPTMQLIADARTMEPAPRERDRVDEISEYTEREKAVTRALPDESEIERIRKEQESRRDPEAAAKLARELGIEEFDPARPIAAKSIP